MFSWTESFKNALLEYVKGNDNPYAVKVTNFREEERSIEGCETCWDDYTVFLIDYEDGTGAVYTYTYYGSMVEFIRVLTFEGDD